MSLFSFFLSVWRFACLILYLSFAFFYLFIFLSLASLFLLSPFSVCLSTSLSISLSHSLSLTLSLSLQVPLTPPRSEEDMRHNLPSVFPGLCTVTFYFLLNKDLQTQDQHPNPINHRPPCILSLS